MNTIDLRIRGRLHRYTGPSAWSELTARQTIAVQRLRCMKTRLTAHGFPLLTLLYGIRPRQLRWLFDETLLRRHGIAEGERLLILEQGQCLLDTLAFVNSYDEMASFNVRGFRRHDYQFGTPVVWLRRLLSRTWYRGPDAGMSNATFGEFMWADMAYRARNWALLAAILYRPGRESFDPATVDARAAQFRCLHPALMAAIQHSYESTLLDLQKRFPLVFPKPDPTAPAKPAGGNWLDVALGLAQLDVTKVHDIEQVNLYLALKTLNTKIKQADELDDQLQAARR